MKISKYETGGLITLSQKINASINPLEEELKVGYVLMAEQNIELAEEGLAADNEALASQEEKLMESE